MVAGAGPDHRRALNQAVGAVPFSTFHPADSLWESSEARKDLDVVRWGYAVCCCSRRRTSSMLLRKA